jgi:hypothetical protein
LVPSGEFSSGFKAVPVVGGSHQVEGKMSDDGHFFGSVTLAQARLIVVEDDIEHPMQSVFDAPMAADRLGEVLSRDWARGDEQAGLAAAAVG